MKFLADENFPRSAVEGLRGASFDVLWIAQSDPGISGEDVLRLSSSTGRTLLTFDKDFGELAYKRGLLSQSGVVLFRLTPQTSEEIAMIALSALQSQPAWEGFFTVVTRQKIRMRPLSPLPR